MAFINDFLISRQFEICLRAGESADLRNLLITRYREWITRQPHLSLETIDIRHRHSAQHCSLISLEVDDIFVCEQAGTVHRCGARCTAQEQTGNGGSCVCSLSGRVLCDTYDAGEMATDYDGNAAAVASQRILQNASEEELQNMLLGFRGSANASQTRGGARQEWLKRRRLSVAESVTQTRARTPRTRNPFELLMHGNPASSSPSFTHRREQQEKRKKRRGQKRRRLQPARTGRVIPDSFAEGDAVSQMPTSTSTAAAVAAVYERRREVEHDDTGDWMISRSSAERRIAARALNKREDDQYTAVHRLITRLFLSSARVQYREKQRAKCEANIGTVLSRHKVLTRNPVVALQCIYDKMDMSSDMRTIIPYKDAFAEEVCETLAKIVMLAFKQYNIYIAEIAHPSNTDFLNSQASGAVRDINRRVTEESFTVLFLQLLREGARCQQNPERFIVDRIDYVRIFLPTSDERRARFPNASFVNVDIRRIINIARDLHDAKPFPSGKPSLTIRSLYPSPPPPPPPPPPPRKNDHATTTTTTTTTTASAYPKTSTYQYRPS
jgi:hypothetical protein